MMRTETCLGDLIAAAMLAWAATGAAAESTWVAISHVNVIPMTGERVIHDQTVVIRDELIHEIGPPDEIDTPAGAKEVDGSGRYLMPGLCDLHVHLRHGKHNPALLTLFLSQGVTTVLNMGAFPPPYQLRDDVNRGEILGPTIYTVGVVLGDDVNPPTYETAARFVRRQAEDNVDFIKVYSFLNPEAYRGIMEEARRLNIPVVGHAVRSVGLEGTFQYGQHLAHMEEVIYGYFPELDASRIPGLIQEMKAAKMAVVATMVTYDHIIKQVEDLETMLKSPGIEFLPAEITREWQADLNRYTHRFDLEKLENGLRPAFEFQQLLVREFHAAEIPVLLGTDSPIPVVVPGYGAHDELQELVDAGLTPYDALAAGTVEAARFLGTEDRIGTIAVGKQADLILLAANPLEEIENSRTIVGVFLKGNWYPKEFFENTLKFE